MTLQSMKRVSSDERFMLRALELARKGAGSVSPNPTVGACVVKSGRLVAGGYHKRFGDPHAEVEAIRKAGPRTRGATLYVTLEPCSTHGKTPPCTKAIQAAQIGCVVVAAEDPNPHHRGRAIRILRRAGIRVRTGVLRKEAEKQIESYAKWMRTRLPFVILKMAQSIDGKIASHTGESKWISGPQARQWVHALRASCDAILVGKNTVLKDDPLLTARNGIALRTPWRIVLDRFGECDPRAQIFRQAEPTVLACSERSLVQVTKKFRRTRATVLPLKESHGHLNLMELLCALGGLGITSLLVEGGGEVAWSFIEAKLVDKIAWIISPKIIGGHQAKTSVEGVGISSLSEAYRIRMDRGVVSLGDDLLFEGYMSS